MAGTRFFHVAWLSERFPLKGSVWADRLGFVFCSPFGRMVSIEHRRLSKGLVPSGEKIFWVSKFPPFGRWFPSTDDSKTS